MNVQREIEYIIQNMKNWMTYDSGDGKGAIVGISGGKDSAVVAALACQAYGKDKVLGVLMPNDIQLDIHDSIEVCEHLDIKYVTVNIADGYRGIMSALEFANIVINSDMITNTPARVRMTVLYAIAASIGYRPLNTCNYSEDYVGYATYGGDGMGAYSPLGNYLTDEVLEMAKYFGFTTVVTKPPSDGLCGKTDEDNMGFTYATLNHYIRTGECSCPITKAKIISMHEKNKFKLELMRMCPRSEAI